jgi:uncharacterized protein (TIGR03067 family)
MRNGVVAICLGLCLTILTRAGDTPKKDAEHLQGAWEATAVEFAGEAGTAKDVKGFKVRIEGDQLALSTASGVVTKTKFKLDPSVSPKAIDLTVVEGNAKGKTALGIYAVKGDELKLCVREVPEGAGRPKDFKTEKGDGTFYATLKRAKK